MLYHRHCHLFVGGVTETEHKKDIGVVEQGVTPGIDNTDIMDAVVQTVLLGNKLLITCNELGSIGFPRRTVRIRP